MGIRRKINDTVFAGAPVLKRGCGRNKIRYIASGTQTDTVKGIVAFSVATGKAYITVDNAGTGTLLGLGL